MVDLKSKGIRRRSTSTYQGRKLIIEIAPSDMDTMVSVREERRRKGYMIPLSTLYKFMARMEAEANLKAKKAAKKAKKDARRLTKSNDGILWIGRDTLKK